MPNVNIKINGKELSVPSDYTILQAAQSAGIYVPTLCYLKEINEIAACRICLVEVKGARSLAASCVYPVNEGMEVFTDTPAVRESRKGNLELILSNHNRKCLSCVRSGNCELQELAQVYGIGDESVYDGEFSRAAKDDSTPWLVRDNSKCILCRRCVGACDNQTVSVLATSARGFDTHIASAFEKPLADTPCIGCGQCVVSCPTGALRERDATDDVYDALADPDKIVIVHPAPSIRATLGEEFGLPVGTNVTGKLAASLRRLGFDKVFDTDFGADLTIIEEANEFIGRVKNGGVLPMITSCSPGWIKFCEHFYPEFIPNLSSCKSPQQMTGAIIKSWYAQENNIDPKNIVVVSVMPCVAKKFEKERPNQGGEYGSDTDIVLTTRELARMLRRGHIDFNALPDEEFDPALGMSTGAASIFGATGGVMEAALRTAADWITGEDLSAIEYNEIRGTDGVKVAEYKVGDLTVKIGVASGTKNARTLLERVKAGEEFHFIEIMACPGGCVNGGGQPLQSAAVRNFTDLKTLRASALYSDDEGLTLRKSHQSPVVKKLYDEFLEKPGSHKAHELLHTEYVSRGTKLRV